MLAGFGVMGFLMRRYDFPIAPVVIGLILGPIAESQLRRALAISLGDPMTLLQSPMSAALLGISPDRAGGAVRDEGPGTVQGERGLVAADKPRDHVLLSLQSNKSAQLFHRFGGVLGFLGGQDGDLASTPVQDTVMDGRA